jgi:peptidoglycan/LPS O-acetylase OafA/YrhL
MKKSDTIKSPPKERDRIVFFDVLRIVFVAFIVYGHAKYQYFSWFNSTFFADGYLPFNIYPLGLSGISVYGIIFVSGAVLEYNYKGIERFSEYVKFLFRRFIRLYPAFWMSLVLGILLFPVLLELGLINIFFEFSGFFVVLGEGPGYINPMGWFIAAIFSLYILFPYLSKIMKKYQISALLSSLVIGYSSRMLLFTYNLIPLDLLYYWFPLCNLFEFCLGIFIVQNKRYPEHAKDHPVIRQLSDLSFYVFLFHIVIFREFFWGSEFSIRMRIFANDLGLGNSFLGYTIWYLMVMGAVILVSWIAMMIDKKIQQAIMQNDTVKTFLQS